MAEALRLLTVVLVAFFTGYLVGSVETTTEFAGVHFCDDCGSPLEQESGKPFDMVLLRKRRDWFNADQKDKQRPLDEMEAAIRRGTSRPEIEAEANGDFYTPGSNSVRATR